MEEHWDFDQLVPAQIKTHGAQLHYLTAFGATSLQLMASSARLRNVGSRSACGSGEANNEFTVHMRNREARHSFDNLRGSSDDQPRLPPVDPDWPGRVLCMHVGARMNTSGAWLMQSNVWAAMSQSLAPR